MPVNRCLPCRNVQSGHRPTFFTVFWPFPVSPVGQVETALHSGFLQFRSSESCPNTYSHRGRRCTPQLVEQISWFSGLTFPSPVRKNPLHPSLALQPKAHSSFPGRIKSRPPDSSARPSLTMLLFTCPTQWPPLLEYIAVPALNLNSGEGTGVCGRVNLGRTGEEVVSCIPTGTELSSRPTPTRRLSTTQNSYYLDG